MTQLSPSMFLKGLKTSNQMHRETLEDIGEKELINRLGKFMPKNQASDDCALIKTKNDTIISIDVLEGIENLKLNA